MAVEARHLNLFHPQIIPNREIITNPMDANMINMYNNTHAGNYSSLLPLSGTTTVSENLLPAAPPYNSLFTDSFAQKANAMKSDSTLTYNNNNNNNNVVVSVPRKRSRDTINNHNHYLLPSYKNNCDTFSFLGEDISHHIHHQQLDINNLVSQHMEKVRVELEEKLKRQARRLMEAIEVGMTKRLKAKEEEIEKIGKLNLALEEKLRDNGEDATVMPAPHAVEEDAESCCGSNYEEGWCTLAMDAHDKDNGEGTSNAMNINNGNSNDKRRLCKNCGKEESCVLILPCRHLCLCTLCGSTLHTCPICKSFKNASVHVNMT